jgi:uncharacterized membrane protein
MPIYHIHPMIVHFPIVLFFLATIIDIYIVGRGGDIAARQTLANLSLILLWSGVALAMVAIRFGIAAAEHAQETGFSMEPIGRHAAFADTTVLAFLVLAIVQTVLRWRRIGLGGGRGWIFSILMLAGAAGVVATAYFGGHLVYDIGVNVNGLKP